MEIVSIFERKYQELLRNAKDLQNQTEEFKMELLNDTKNYRDRLQKEADYYKNEWEHAYLMTWQKGTFKSRYERFENMAERLSESAIKIEASL